VISCRRVLLFQRTTVKWVNMMKNTEWMNSTWCRPVVLSVLLLISADIHPWCTNIQLCLRSSSTFLWLFFIAVHTVHSVAARLIYRITCRCADSVQKLSDELCLINAVIKMEISTMTLSAFLLCILYVELQSSHSDTGSNSSCDGSCYWLVLLSITAAECGICYCDFSLHQSHSDELCDKIFTAA